LLQCCRMHTGPPAGQQWWRRRCFTAHHCASLALGLAFTSLSPSLVFPCHRNKSHCQGLTRCNHGVHEMLEGPPPPLSSHSAARWIAPICSGQANYHLHRADTACSPNPAALHVLRHWGWALADGGSAESHAGIGSDGWGGSNGAAGGARRSCDCTAHRPGTLACTAQPAML
jgi:hypothetical protein